MLCLDLFCLFDTHLMTCGKTLHLLTLNSDAFINYVLPANVYNLLVLLGEEIVLRKAYLFFSSALTQTSPCKVDFHSYGPNLLTKVLYCGTQNPDQPIIYKTFQKHSGRPWVKFLVVSHTFWVVILRRIVKVEQFRLFYECPINSKVLHSTQAPTKCLGFFHVK